jgi:hypothetical protein
MWNNEINGLPDHSAPRGTGAVWHYLSLNFADDLRREAIDANLPVANRPVLADASVQAL